MDFSREISRLLLALLAAFAAMGIAAAYWALTGEETLLRRDDNPRRVQAEATLRRGSIYDRGGVRLAQTVPGSAGQVRRQYDHPALYSALGYFSLRYGAGGTEAAYNAILRGDTLPRSLLDHFEQDVLHRPQTGSDIQLTLSLPVQQALLEALAGYTGGALLLSVPQGDILAMVSLPAYNPNRLDEDWNELIRAPGNPFFNRVLQGVYQSGGTLQTPLLAAALLTRQPVDQIIVQGAQPVTLDGLTLTCVTPPPASAIDLDLVTAYLYGCPYPFQTLATTLGEPAVNDILAAFRLSQTLLPDGFAPPEDASLSATATPTATAVSPLANALGQGAQTITLPAMAGMAAGMVNGGNMPAPVLLRGVRAPGADWQAVVNEAPALPLIPDTIARRLSEIMIAGVTTGVVPAGRPPLVIGGHTALAYSGDSVQTWFIGFVQVDAGRSVALALVLEDTRDPAAAARIAARALAAAHEVLSAENP